MEPDEVRRDLAGEKRLIDDRLRAILRGERGIPVRLRQAMAHSLLGGGKRLRPALLLWTYDAVARDRRRRPREGREAAESAAAAVECVHSYSLIHDDLPAMDDDVLRRGRPTCHVAFDEATAILAGDALQALAFGVLGRLGPTGAVLVDTLATAAGPTGMAGGQQDDIESEHSEASATLVGRIHRRKTAALIAASLVMGGHLAGASEKLGEGLHGAGIDLGLAFQGADDVLDATANSHQLGKSAGKDAEAGKATWVRIEGLEKAGRRAARHGRSGRETLEHLLPEGRYTERLLGLADLMWQRDR